MNRRNSALRVAFLTDSAFEKLNATLRDGMKKRALRRIEREVRYPVVENCTNPDIIFRVIRNSEGGWMLRKHNRR